MGFKLDFRAKRDRNETHKTLKWAPPTYNERFTSRAEVARIATKINLGFGYKGLGQNGLARLEVEMDFSWTKVYETTNHANLD